MSAVADATASRQEAYLQRLRALASAAVSARVMDIALALTVFGAAFALYNATLAPGLTYVSLDGNEMATVPYRLALAHSPGYPFFTWVGKLFTFLPFGDIAYRMNLMCALSGAGTCALLYATTSLLTRSRLAASIIALVAVVSVDLWSQSVITEVYAPNAFMLALSLFLLLTWGERLRSRIAPVEQNVRSMLPFWAGCLVLGLSLGTHLSNVAFVPGVVLYVLLLRRPYSLRLRPLLAGAGLFALAACQFLWLLPRASTLNDDLMLQYKPTNLIGVYNYMFNVFQVDRFAFPLSTIPDRISVYAGLVKDTFGVPGIVIALIGMWDMCRERRQAFCLLAIAYLVELAYFLEYNVPDISVFYIPAHLIVAVFIAFGLRKLIFLSRRAVTRFQQTRPLLVASLCLLVALPPLLRFPANWSENDHRGDTTVEDFYSQVFLTLPQNSVLLGHPGVPGFDLFHSYLTSSRSDVSVPQLKTPFASEQDLGGGPLFLTISPDTLRSVEQRNGNSNNVSDNLWYVPVIAAPSTFVSWLGGHPLTLYKAQAEPPQLFVDDPHPQHLVGQEMDGVRLLGFDVDDTEVATGGLLHLRLYWQPVKPTALTYYRVSLTLGDDDTFREIHTLGFGLIQRYQKERQLPQDTTLVEDYNLVVMSSLAPGNHLLKLSTCDFGPLGSRTAETVDLVQINVTKP